MHQHIFIVNPTSGGGKSLRIVKKIETVCQNEKLDYKIHYTTSPKNAMEIAKSYHDQEKIIYSVGGDGTLNEVVNGIVGSKNLLGIIPSGSGNDFFKTLKTIDEPQPIIDLGKINNTYFINIVCIGIDAEVANNVFLMKEKKIPTSFLYSTSILYTFIKFKPKKINILFNDKQITDNFTIITVCNGRFYGGGYQIAPNADLSDGIFDLYIVKQLSKLKIPRLILKLAKGTHENSPYMSKFPVDKLSIRSDENIVCNVDGETLTSKKFEIEIVKNAITLYNNKELIAKFLEP